MLAHNVEVQSIISILFLFKNSIRLNKKSIMRRNLNDNLPKPIDSFKIINYNRPLVYHRISAEK